MEIGITSFVEAHRCSDESRTAIREVVEKMIPADEVRLDVFLYI